MKYLLIAMLAFYVAAVWQYQASTKRSYSADESIAPAILSFMAAGAGLVLTVIYIALVLWNHQLL